jgi:hypothetical protein
MAGFDLRQAQLEIEHMQLIYAMHKEIERHAVAIQEGQ